MAPFLYSQLNKWLLAIETNEFIPIYLLVLSSNGIEL